MRTYKFRLYPNKTQEKKLLETLDICRFTYNQLLEKINGKEKITKYELQHYILELKQKYPQLKNVYSKVLQYENYRLFANIKGLAISKRNGNKIGRLRFKGEQYFKTFQYNQSGFKLIGRNDKKYDILHLSKIGDIHIMKHRNIEGKIKQIIIKRKVNSWYAHIITDAEYKMKKGNGIIGIDLGVINYIVDTNNQKVENPLFLKTSLNKIQKNHQNISSKKKGSNNRKKSIKKLLKSFEKIDNQKNDFIHKLTTKIIGDNKIIVIEDLNIKNMVDKSKGNNKYHNKRNIHDSSWRRFISMLKFKAERAGSSIIEINPKNTSKTCSRCGNIKKLKLSDRLYECDNCGLHIDRDYNASLNILQKGLVRAFVKNDLGHSKQEATSLTA